MVRHHDERVFADADATHLAQVMVKHHLLLLHIASAVRPLQVLGEGECPIANDNVVTSHVGSRKFPWWLDVRHSFLYSLVEGTVTPYSPTGLMPALACIHVNEFKIGVN